MNQTATNINLQREGIISNNLENAELQNDFVVSDLVPYSNSTFINEREIAYIESGNNLEEVSNFYSEILSIAQQCPYTGGPAVERARTLIAMVNDSVFYDDANICLQVGVYRQADPNAPEQKVNSTIIVKPNPASEKIQVILHGDFSSGVCVLTINNTIGEPVFKREVNCVETSIDIDISKLTQGIYSVKVTTGNVSLIQKLTIVR
ncbi:MAG: T9SS type A sorting domain-containing protein [Bacteroidetes bacterium]|nr:T9SS type A sorting domain-containing protein [Bacteroidota bacterium]